MSEVTSQRRDSSVRRSHYPRFMQQGLFDQPTEIDFTKDPYAEKRESGRRLAQEFVIDEAQGFDLMLTYGSETAARNALIQRWYRDEVGRRDEAA